MSSPAYRLEHTVAVAFTQFNGTQFSTHGATLFPGCLAFLKPRCSPDRIDGQVDLPLPIEFLPVAGHLGILFKRPRQSLGQIGNMGRQFGGHNPFTDIIQIGKAQMFRRRHITQEVRPGSPGNGSADGGRDMIIAGSNICW